jgi:type II secretory pathway predicted ATPase ExeA
MSKKLLALYGLKFNPFSSQVPTDALWSPPPLEEFCWRIEQQVGEGGFALVSGDPGTGKSAALRLLAARLARVRDLTVGILTRPQASLADFYRELGHLFGVALSPHNRWASAKVLREKWLQHQDAARLRPVLLVDEAQEMGLAVFSELRLLSSAELDSRSILTVVLAGDSRLGARLESVDLLPLASRIRSRLRTEALAPPQLLACLQHLLSAAGNPKLLPPPLLQTLSEHAAGNLRLLINLGNDLLQAALRQEREVLDEKLYFEVFASEPKPPRAKRP